MIRNRFDRPSHAPWQFSLAATALWAVTGCGGSVSVTGSGGSASIAGAAPVEAAGSGAYVGGSGGVGGHPSGSAGAGGAPGAAGTFASGGGGGASAGSGGASAGSGGAVAEGGAPTSSAPSCAGLPAICGVRMDGDCCASSPVPGGSFMLGPSRPGTVATFVLDTYEVTVARFRNFVNTYTGHPANGAAAHPLIAGSGWQSPAWDSSIAADKAALIAGVQCDAVDQTWSATSHDTLPMNCVDWYEAFAFCAWDGGRLPTDAEWQYAAQGGSDHRLYPWSAPPLDDLPDTSAYANYFCLADDGACAFTDILPVGSKTLGVGRYGQLDLAGSMAEWALDLGFGTQINPCDNCANLTQGTRRVIRGGDWGDNAQALANTDHRSDLPTSHDPLSGFRCARSL